MTEADARAQPADPVTESVRRALQLVGPGEAGSESVWDEESGHSGS